MITHMKLILIQLKFTPLITCAHATS